MLGFVKLFLFRKRWRKTNGHNRTVPSCPFPQSSVRVGNATYGALNVLDFGGEHRLNIGNYCSIGPQVTFVLQADHYLDHVTTYPVKAKIVGGISEAISKGDITLDDDVWIGCNAVR